MGSQGGLNLGHQGTALPPQLELEQLEPHFWYWPNWAS